MTGYTMSSNKNELKMPPIIGAAIRFMVSASDRRGSRNRTGCPIVPQEREGVIRP